MLHLKARIHIEKAGDQFNDELLESRNKRNDHMVFNPVNEILPLPDQSSSSRPLAERKMLDQIVGMPHFFKPRLRAALEAKDISYRVDATEANIRHDHANRPARIFGV